MPAQALSQAEIRARQLRQELKLGDVAPVTDIVETIERCGIPVFLTPLPGTIAGLASRALGRWFVAGDTETGPPGRLRFTLAHELGHIWMDHEPSVDDPSTLNMTGGPAPDHEEVAANAFAAEFLLPRYAIDDYMRAAADVDWAAQGVDVLRELAQTHHTTVWVPLFRLRTTGWASRRDEQVLREAMVGTAFEDTHEDTCGAYAGTGGTRMPPEHKARLESSIEAGIGDEDEDE